MTAIVLIQALPENPVVDQAFLSRDCGAAVTAKFSGRTVCGEAFTSDGFVC